MPEKKSLVLVDSTGWIEHFIGGNLASKFRPYIEPSTSENAISTVVIGYEVYKRLRPVIGEDDAVEKVGQIRRKTRMVDLSFERALSAADLSIGEKLGMAMR